MTFTVFEAPGVCERDGRRDFYTASRVWLGYVPGTDWIHGEPEAEFASVRREIESERRSIRTIRISCATCAQSGLVPERKGTKRDYSVLVARPRRVSTCRIPRHD
jgi:hypothetical protein